VPAVVEEQERNAADEIALPGERQDTLGVERDVSPKLGGPDPNARHQPVRHLCKHGNFGRLRATDFDIRAQRQGIEIMPCGKRAPFHTHVTPLSFEAFVPRYADELSGWGSGVCSSYCTGVLR